MIRFRCQTWLSIFHGKVQQNDKGHVAHRRWAIGDGRDGPSKLKSDVVDINLIDEYVRNGWFLNMWIMVFTMKKLYNHLMKIFDLTLIHEHNLIILSQKTRNIGWIRVRVPNPNLGSSSSVYGGKQSKYSGLREFRFKLSIPFVENCIFDPSTTLGSILC